MNQIVVNLRRNDRSKKILKTYRSFETSQDTTEVVTKNFANTSRPILDMAGKIVSKWEDMQDNVLKIWNKLQPVALFLRCQR